ncbi:MAG: iron complex outermembrane receptor protein [Gammaproteobacteria bacterium]|jgi:iron complex outermembrane receptor protein
MFLRVTTACLIAAAPGLFAADTGTRADEEVIVRAGFYDTEFMQSAGGISVIDDIVIQDRAARHLDEVLGVLPNVSFTAGGGRARFVQIRGVGDLEQFVDPKHFPSVGITIDGIEVGTTATGASLIDVNQIDVLRGPQGTRFGANALAGMINIRTHDPSDVLSGYVDAGYANFDTWHVGGAVSGPLSENVAGRIALQQYSSDGFIDNVFLRRDDTNDRDEFSTRSKLHWSLGETADIRFTAAYTDIDNGYDAFSLENTRRTRTDQPGEDAQESLSLGLSSNWAFTEGIQLETLVSWYETDETYGFDEDWVFAGFCDGVRCNPLFEYSSEDILERERDVIAADIRLKSDPARLSWVLGFYTQHRDEDLDRQHFGSFSSQYKTERYAAYGQLIFQIAPQWILTGGIRVEHFKDEYTDTNALVTDSSDDYWTGELTLEHLFSDDVLFYGTLSRGVKPGGVNTDTSSNLPIVSAGFQSFLTSRQRFSSETLFNKEIGLKASFLDRRLRLRLSGFHMDRYDAQLESFVVDGFIFTSFLDSTSDAENYGAELELNYAANRFVDLFANVGYLETSVDRLTVFDLGTFAFRESNNRDQAKSPNWTYNVGANLSFNDRLRGRIEVEGRDENFFGYYHDGKIDAYALAHASMSYDLGPVTVQAWIRNMFNTNNQIHGLFFANDPRDAFTINRSYYQRGEPRVFGVNLNYVY